MIVDIDLQMAQLEVKLLRSQFNSHFLFNHLNAINYCILNNDPRAASSYLTLFSRLLRRTLEGSRHEFVKLSEEIETLRLYLQLENLRFERAIELRILTDPEVDADALQVPSFLLHMYVENALWSSTLSRSTGDFLVLHLQKRADKYHIQLESHGVISQESHSGSWSAQAGLHLVDERLKLLNERYRTDIQVECTQGLDAHTPRPRSRVNISFTPFFITNWK